MKLKKNIATKPGRVNSKPPGETGTPLDTLKSRPKGKKRFVPAVVGLNFLLLSLILPCSIAAQATETIFGLQRTIESALEANLELKSSKEEIMAAAAQKKAQRTNFFPTFSANYQYTRHDEERQQIGIGVIRPEDEYSFSASIKQPIFTGFSLSNQYRIAALGMDVAKVREKLKRQDIILEAKRAYFSLLRAQKLKKIAEDTVTQISAQKEVANNFYQVGMTPLNDLLQAQVELANARQELIVARNNLENAESNFNLLLRRPIELPVMVQDIQGYTPFRQSLAYCLAEAEKNRPEIVVAKLDLERVEKEIELARKDYYPTVTLNGTYYRQGVEWYTDGGEGISAPDGWDISAVASWNFWEWGRTTYGVKEKLSRQSQAKLKMTDIVEKIRLEVKQAYLRTQEADRAIQTVEEAIAQAKENFRINEERYKEQVATSTDVLIAQTLLSRTMTNYYTALYEFKTSKATLYRTMGQEIME